jgi:hypothetical protein
MRTTEILRLELAMAEAMEDPVLEEMVTNMEDEVLTSELLESGIKFMVLLAEANRRCPE